jgi:hypothetical protein
MCQAHTSCLSLLLMSHSHVSCSHISCLTSQAHTSCLRLLLMLMSHVSSSHLLLKPPSHAHVSSQRRPGDGYFLLVSFCRRNDFCVHISTSPYLCFLSSLFPWLLRLSSSPPPSLHCDSSAFSTPPPSVSCMRSCTASSYPCGWPSRTIMCCRDRCG